MNLRDQFPRVLATCAFCCAHEITDLCGPTCHSRHKKYCPHYKEEGIDGLSRDDRNRQAG